MRPLINDLSLHVDLALYFLRKNIVHLNINSLVGSAKHMDAKTARLHIGDVCELDRKVDIRSEGERPVGGRAIEYDLGDAREERALQDDFLRLFDDSGDFCALLQVEFRRKG